MLTAKPKNGSRGRPGNRRGRLRDEALRYSRVAGAHSCAASAADGRCRWVRLCASPTSKWTSTSTRRCAAGGAWTLTGKEFEVLRLLFGHRGEIVTRDRLLDEVWGYESYPTTRTVDNHILRLRQKLEEDPRIRATSFRFMERDTNLSAEETIRDKELLDVTPRKPARRIFLQRRMDHETNNDSSSDRDGDGVKLSNHSARPIRRASANGSRPST